MSMIERTCELCGKTFLIRESRLRYVPARYCSRECANEGKRRRVTVFCRVCDKPFTVKQSDYDYRVRKGEPPTYCSRQCANGATERRQAISRSLKNSAAFQAKQRELLPALHERLRQPEQRRLHSEKTRQAWQDPEKRAHMMDGIKQRSQDPAWRSAPHFRRDKQHPRYTGNQQDRNRYESKAWRKAVFARDNYTCQECGKCGPCLVAHHKQPWADHPELRFDVDNGITLCETCHDKAHGKTRRPKTFKCVVCGQPKESGQGTRCKACGRRHLTPLQPRPPFR